MRQGICLSYCVALVLRGGPNRDLGGVPSIKEIFWPLTSKPGQGFTGYRDSALMVISVNGVILVLVDALGAPGR
jgi:hypothetical protein